MNMPMFLQSSGFVVKQLLFFLLIHKIICVLLFGRQFPNFLHVGSRDQIKFLIKWWFMTRWNRDGLLHRKKYMGFLHFIKFLDLNQVRISVERWWDTCTTINPFSLAIMALFGLSDFLGRSKRHHIGFTCRIPPLAIYRCIRKKGR